MKHLYYAQEIYYLKALIFFQKKVVGGQSPVNDRRVGGKHNTVKQADSGLGEWMLRNFQGESLKPNTSLRFVRLPSACHGWDSSRWPPTLRGPPWTFLSIYPPKTESACLTALYLSLTLVTLTEAIPDHLSLEKVNLEVQLTVFCI